MCLLNEWRTDKHYKCIDYGSLYIALCTVVSCFVCTVIYLSFGKSVQLLHKPWGEMFALESLP